MDLRQYNCLRWEINRVQCLIECDAEDDPAMLDSLGVDLAFLVSDIHIGGTQYKTECELRNHAEQYGLTATLADPAIVAEIPRNENSDPLA